MANDEAARLGPKGHVYVELAREQWRAPLERGGARRAILTTLLSLALIVGGIVGAFVTNPEAVVLIAVGLIGLATSLPELRQLRPEFEEARRIGWVEPSLDDTHVTVGEPATFSVVLHARRELTVTAATLRAECRRWHGAASGDVLHTIDIPAAVAGAHVRSGEDWREAATFRVPTDAPPSHYSAVDSVRWTIALGLQFANAEPWARSWPMLVFPSDAT